MKACDCEYGNGNLLNEINKCNYLRLKRPSSFPRDTKSSITKETARKMILRRALSTRQEMRY